MAKLVIELQKDCLNSKMSLTELLRKARLIAQKLDITEMINFCTNELEGYKNKVPDYRYISVIYKAYNPVRKEWIPVEIPSDLPISKFLKRPVILSIGELERFLEEGEPILNMGVPPEMQDAIYHDLGQSYNFEINSFFQKTQFARILDSVKNKISDWSLGLERKGILGEEYEFSTDEKEKAQNMSITNIFNAPINGSNIVATATNSTLNVNNTNSFDYEGVEKLLESVQKLLPAGNFAKSDLEKIQQDIDEIKVSISKQDIPAVKGKLKDLADFCKGIAGNVIASGVWAQIQPFLC